MDVQTEMITDKGGHRVLLSLDGRQIETPPVEHLAFYVGLVVLVEAGLVELPVALALAVGHVLLDVTRRPGMVALGEALGEA